MKRLLIPAFTLLALLLAGCKEDPKVHVDKNDILLPTKGAFPEGESKFDDLLVEIQRKYNFTIYYKNISNTNFSAITNGATTADEQELPDWLKPHYINFLQRHILDYFVDHGDWFPKILKKNMMFVKNLRRRTPGGWPSGSSAVVTIQMIDASVSFGTALPAALGNSYLGEDYVSLCLFSDTWSQSAGKGPAEDGYRGPYATMGNGFSPPRTEAEFKRLRAKFMAILFVNAVKAGYLAVPTQIFQNRGVDFSIKGYNAKTNPNGYLNATQDDYYSGVGTVTVDDHAEGTGLLAQTTAGVKNIMQAPGYFKTWGSMNTTTDYVAGSVSLNSDQDTVLTASNPYPSQSHYYTTNYYQRKDAEGIQVSRMNAEHVFLHYLYHIMAYDMDPNNPATANTPANWYFPGTEAWLWQDCNHPLEVRYEKESNNTISFQRIEDVKDDIIAYMLQEYGIDLLAISRGPEPMFRNLLAQ